MTEMMPRTIARHRLGAVPLLALTLFFTALLLAGSVSTATAGVAGSRLQSSGPDITKGRYREVWLDMRVKVPGGYVSVIRSWNGEAWTINPALNDLEIEGDPGQPSGLKRGKVAYAFKQGSTELSYQSKAKKLLRKTETGYRWRDLRGNWTEYDAAGRAIAFGNHATKLADVLRDPEGRISGFQDAAGLEVITYTYDAEGNLTQASDYTGRTVTYTYTAGVLSKVTDIRGKEWTFEYQNGWLTRRIDPEGRFLDLTYSATGRLRSISDAIGLVTEYKFSYDSRRGEYYVQEKDAAGGVVESTYDRGGLLLYRSINGRPVHSLRLDGDDHIVTNEDGHTTRYVRDVLGRTTRIEYPDGGRKEYAYWRDLGLLVRIVDERGTNTLLERDESGNLVRVTEAAGLPEERVTEREYDTFGQMTRLTQIVDGADADRVTQIEYDAHGNSTRTADPVGDVHLAEYSVRGDVTKRVDPRGKEWITEYDAAGNQTLARDPQGGEQYWQYDGVGNLVLFGDELGAETQYEYDARNNRTALVDALTHRWVWEYDERSLLTRSLDPEGHSELFEYDLEGRVVAHTNGNGLQTSIEYFAARSEENAGTEQLVRVTYPTFVRELRFGYRGRRTSRRDLYSGNSREDCWTYDTAGSVSSFRRSDGRETVFTYDPLGRLREKRLPDLSSIRFQYGKWGETFRLIDGSGHVTEYQHDQAGRLVKEVREGGRETEYTYAAGGLLATRVGPDGRRLEHSYDERSVLVRIDAYLDAEATIPEASHTWIRDAAHRLRSYAGADASGTYTYDAIGRLTSASVDYGEFEMGHSVEYFRNGLVKEFTSPDGISYTYTYDGNDQLRSVEIPGAGSIVFSTYEWLAPTRIQYPGGTVREIEYDGLLQHQRIRTLDPAGNPIMDRQYTRASSGFVSQIDGERGSVLYTYDLLDRLTGVEDGDGIVENYTYDASGNRLPGDPVVAAEWLYSARDELLAAGGTTYEYDAASRTVKKLESGEELSYEYNAFGRLKRVTRQDGAVVGEYGYDAFGRRVWKEVDGVRRYFYYSDNGLLAETDAAGTVERTYGYLPAADWTTAPLFTRMGDDVHYYQNDHLGTPQYLVQPDGAPSWAGEFEAYGRPAVKVLGVENQLLFPGQYYDEETGLHYNHSRYYDPAIGRYISTDPIGQAGGTNLFAYAVNNPVNLIDPLGLLCAKGAAEYSKCMAKCQKDNPVLERYKQTNAAHCTPLYVSCIAASGGIPANVAICRAGKTACQAAAAAEAAATEGEAGLDHTKKCHEKCKAEADAKCKKCEDEAPTTETGESDE